MGYFNWDLDFGLYLGSYWCNGKTYFNPYARRGGFTIRSDERKKRLIHLGGNVAMRVKGVSVKRIN